MKSVLVATSLMAAMAMSKPLEKRYYVTETDVYTVTVTVTGWGPWGLGQTAAPETTAAAVAAANPTNGWGNWGNWGNWGRPSADPTTTASAADLADPTSTWSSWGGQPADPTTTSSAVAPAWTPSSSWTQDPTSSWTQDPASSWTTEAPASSWTSASTSQSPVNTQTSTPAATSWSSGSSSAPNSYAQAILDQHNNHRQNHSAQALIWDDDLTSIAQQIAESCVYAHNTQAGGGGYGQNIGAGASPDAVPALITNEMYNDEIGWFPLPYGQAQPDMSNFEQWGHFSQIVWQSTVSVGCATVNCPNGLANTGSGVSPWFTVCNYKPPGNFEGEYGANIAQPLGEPVVIVPSS